MFHGIVMATIVYVSFPQNVPKQCLTGRTKDGSVFPLLVKFTGASLEPICQEATDKECRDDHEEGVTEGDSEEDPPSPLQEDPPSRVLTHGKVVVYAALSGMVCFNSDGSIEGCNHHFSLMLFGYSQKELLKKVLYIVIYTVGMIVFYVHKFKNNIFKFMYMKNYHTHIMSGVHNKKKVKGRECESPTR